MSKNNLIFRITDLEVAKSPLDEKIVGIFRYDQATRQKNGPALLILAEIHSTLYVYERFLDAINAATEQARYLVSQVDQDPLARFEKLVDRLNKASADFAAQEATPLAWNRVNLFVIEFSDGQMCLTGIGKLMNMFLQKQEDGGYRSFDIIGSLEQPVEPDPAKPFAAVICGEMKPGDAFMLGTMNFERFRSDLRLKERLAGSPAVTAALDIKNDIETRRIPDDFVAAIVTCIEEKRTEAPIVAPPKETSTSSVQKLREAESQAAQHLGPTVAPINADPKRLLDKAKGLLAKTKERLTPPKPKAIDKPKDPVALASLRGMNAGYGSRFTKKHKNIAIAVVVGLVVIFGGYAYWQHRMKVAAQVAAWQATYDQIADLKNQADSDLIYGNDGKAEGEAKQADDMLATLPGDSPDHKAKLTTMQAGMKEVHDKLKKLVELDNGVQLTALAPGAAPNSLSALVLAGDEMYAVDASQQAVIKVNLLDHETKSIPLPAGTSPIVSGSAGKTSILFATNDGHLLSVDLQTDQIKPVPWSNTQSSSTPDVVQYTTRIYSLDPAHNQIWRSSASGGGYGPESGYIKAANTSLNDAVAMAIDSNVYVLKADGSVVQFTQGGETGFALLTPDPPMVKPTDIWAQLDSTYIAIADPASKRVLLYDKSGNLHAQIQSTQFHNPSKVALDEQNKRLVVIDGNSILLFPLP